MDFDALAAAGQLDAAIRALLLHALVAAGWRPGKRGASRTAREVVRALALEDPRRPILAEIVMLTEAVRFGGAAATRERFQALRHSFDRLVRPQAAAASGAV
jgi:hypothetical protein